MGCFLEIKFEIGKARLPIDFNTLAGKPNASSNVFFVRNIKKIVFKTINNLGGHHINYVEQYVMKRSTI